MTSTATYEKPVKRRQNSENKKKSPTAKLLNLMQEAVKEEDDRPQVIFSEHSRTAARQSGCRYLFELPAILINETQGISTAFLYNNSKRCQLFFLIYSTATRKVSMVEAKKAPEKVVEFAWSYAKVLSLLSQVGNEAMQ